MHLPDRAKGRKIAPADAEYIKVSAGRLSPQAGDADRPPEYQIAGFLQGHRIVVAGHTHDGTPRQRISSASVTQSLSFSRSIVAGAGMLMCG